MRREAVKELKATLVQHAPVSPLAGLFGSLLMPFTAPLLGFAMTGAPRRVGDGFGLGIGSGRGAEDFRLAVRFPARTPDTDRALEYLEKVSHGEMEVRYTGRASKLSTATGSLWHQMHQRPLKIGCSLGHSGCWRA